MILIADAAPLIFLAKINQLQLIPCLFEAEILVPSVVKNEVLAPKSPPDETRLLEAFISECEVVDLYDPKIFTTALSFADNCVLTLAERERADMILSDDRLVRKVAGMEGFRVLGTLGILMYGRGKALLPREKAINLLEVLVARHDFRISATVYNTAHQELLSERKAGRQA